MERFKLKSIQGDWKYFNTKDVILFTDFDYRTKCIEVFNDGRLKIYESDIFQTKDNNKVIVIDKDLVKVIIDNNLEDSNKDLEFLMNLNNFIKYNSFYYIGNKFDFLKGETD